MPIVTNTTTTSVRLANTAMSRAFFSRAKKWLYPKVCGSYTSVALVEPHAILGAAPPLRRFDGFLRANALPSFSMNIPNPLFKNLLPVDRTEYEGDQTGTMAQLGTQVGVQLAEFPEQLWTAKLLTGSTAGSQTEVFRGTSYTNTLDGQPLFSASHDDWAAGSTQSNILQGTLPSTSSSLVADDWATNAVKMQKDLQVVINALRTVKNTNGLPIYPSLDPADAIVVLVPPVLLPIAKLAFATATSVINQTTNIAPTMVKEVVCSGYLAGLPSPFDGSALTPVNETDWYVCVVDDYVKPFYIQLYRPPKNSELFPPDYDAAEVIDKMLKAQSEITVDAATLYASTSVDTTFNRVGANADQATIQSESFWMSARWRGNMAYGPWFTAWRIIPVGGS